MKNKKYIGIGIVVLLILSYFIKIPIESGETYIITDSLLGILTLTGNLSASLLNFNVSPLILTNSFSPFSIQLVLTHFNLTQQVYYYPI